MKSIYLIVIVYLMTSCNFQKSKRTDNNQNPNLPVDSVSTNNTIENLTEIESNSEILELPVIGTFELTSMKTDSLNKYGAGDCWGKVRRYSLPNVGLAIDSMTCGEYGYTYTYYLLNTKDSIQVVFTKKSESIFNSESNSYFYIQQEHLIDFNSDPAISMTRIDTVYDYNLRLNQIDRKFATDILKDKQTT